MRQWPTQVIAIGFVCEVQADSAQVLIEIPTDQLDRLTTTDANATADRLGRLLLWRTWIQHGLSMSYYGLKTKILRTD
jgi:hypothetical protein